MIQPQAFEILKFRKLHNWKLLSVDDSIPFVCQERCPCDDTFLRVAVTMVGEGGRRRLRLGCCDSCGYTGYMDRPTKEWIDQFYYETWNTTEEMFDGKKIAKARARYEMGKDRPVNALRIVQSLKLPIHKEHAVCDVGCGFGITLARMRDAGFRNIIGTESSLQRSAIAEKIFGIKVVTAPFENEAAQKELRIKAPFGLIFSHHVLEHVYHPHDIIRAASGLQDEGGYFILSMPNLEGEFSLSRLLYLPHLHSYTKSGLTRLLARHGYAVIDDSFTSRKELCLVARKSAGPVKTPEASGGNASVVFKKFSDYFGSPPAGRSLFWGFRSIDVAGSLPYFGETVVTRAVEIGASRLFPWWYRNAVIAAQGFPPEGRPSLLTLVRRGVARRFTPVAESPIEVQFPGRIMLTYK